MPWFIAATVPQMESNVEKGFRELRVPCYIPKEIRTIKLEINGYGKRVRKPTRQIERPLIPGYAFVQTEGAQLPNRRQVDGLSRYLCLVGSDDPHPISGDFVERMQACERAGMFDNRPRSQKPRQNYTVGQDVKIIGSSFAGFFAKVAATKDRSARVSLVVEMLGSFVPVDADKNQIEPVEARAA